MNLPRTKDFKRTQKAQVTPDPMMARRFDFPYSTEGPVAEGGPTGTLMGPGSILDDVDIEYQFDETKGQSYLVTSKPLFTVNVKGDPAGSKKIQSEGQSRFNLLSSTSKMSCPSLSLPAGPIHEGGTCFAAALRANSLVRPARGTDPGGSRTESGRLFVCDSCYALAGNYVYPSNAGPQAVRLAWIHRLLLVDPTGRTLGEHLHTAIDDFARRATMRSLSERLGLEIGLWTRGAIRAPGYVSGRKDLRYMEVAPTSLPEGTGYRDTFEAFTAMGVPEGAPCGFFRVHDSGDLNVGSDLKLWIGYLHAWEHVAEELPWIWFWIPTRTWMVKRMIEPLQQASRLPNLIIRNSSLFVDGALPPDLGIPRSGVHSPGAGAPSDQYPCPVAPNDQSSYGKEGCRACWIARDTIPSYTEH